MFVLSRGSRRRPGEKMEIESDLESDTLESTTPDTVARHCTDVPCLIAFVLATVCFGAIIQNSWPNSNLRRLEVFKDGARRHCLFTPETAGKMFLYFCNNVSDSNPSGLGWPMGQAGSSSGSAFSLDLHHPVCVASCSIGGNGTVAECGGAINYPTKSHMNMLCMPKRHKARRRQVRPWRQAATDTVLASVIIQRRDWLISVNVAAIVISYCLIRVLQKQASTLVTLGITLISVVTISLGLYLLGFFSWFASFLPGLPKVLATLSLVPSAEWQWPGLLLLAVGVGWATKSCAMRGPIDVAADCIEMSCTCILQTPYLIVHPVMVALAYALILCVLTYTSLIVFSTGSAPCVSGGVDHAPSLTEVACAIFIVFFSVWVHQTLFMVSEFVVAYAAAMWSFHGGLQGEGQVSQGVIMRAWWACLRYHLGTCMYGALAISVMRPITLPLGALMAFLEIKGNAVGSILRACCCYCSDLFARVRPLKKVAYVDVVMNSAPFCEASRESLKVILMQEDTVRVLNGASWLFQVAGLTFIGGMGAFIVFMRSAVLRDSPRVVMVTCAAGAASAFFVALPFAMIFDTVADTILYCHQLERMRAIKDAPEKDHDVWCLPCVTRGLAPLTDALDYYSVSYEDREFVQHGTEVDFE